MKIFIICSKVFYSRIEPIKQELESMGHQIELPNCYDHPTAEKEATDLGEQNHVEFKRRMFERSQKIASQVDAVLVLNYEKHGQPNYIGGATFLEMYDAFNQRKKIFLWNDIPKGILYDEIHGFGPIIISGDLKKVK